VEREKPDAAVVDVRMPPTFTDEGLRAAAEARRRQPGLPILVLSAYVEDSYAADLLAGGAGGVGYLLKERVGDVDAFIDAVGRVASGGSALDPEVVGRMLGRRARQSTLAALTPRERQVLAAMAEGKSNGGIADELVVTQAAVEKHVTNIFLKLGLAPTPTEHRRVLAVLTFMRSASA